MRKTLYLVGHHGNEQDNDDAFVEDCRISGVIHETGGFCDTDLDLTGAC